MNENLQKRANVTAFLIARGVVKSIVQWSDEDLFGLEGDIDREKALSIEAALGAKTMG